MPILEKEKPELKQTLENNICHRCHRLISPENSCFFTVAVAADILLQRGDIGQKTFEDIHKQAQTMIENGLDLHYQCGPNEISFLLKKTTAQKTQLSVLARAKKIINGWYL